MYRFIALMLLLVGLSACSTLPTGTSRGSLPTTAGERLPESPQARVMYHLLVGDLSLREDDKSGAVAAYDSAMASSGDPAIAERATRIAFYAGDNDAALRAAKRWLALRPDSTDAMEALGVLYLRKGDRARSEAYFRQVLKASGTEVEQAFANLGAILGEEDDSKAALTVMRDLVAKYPKVAGGHFALSQLAYKSGRHALALREARRSVELAPRWVPGYLLMADLEDRTGDKKAAAKTMREALKLKPEDRDLRIHYARMLYALGRTDDALGQFERLLKTAPNDSKMLYAASILAMQANRAHAARRYLLRLNQLEPDNGDVHYYLGRLAESQGNYREAQRWFKGVTGGYAVEAKIQSAVILGAQGNLASAVARLQALRRANADSAVQTYLVEAELYSKAGRDFEALQVYDRALAQNKDNADLLYGRAMVYVRLDNFSQAEADLRSIIKRDPNDARALNALGFTLADRGESLQEARQLIEKAYRLKPEDAAIIDSMGWVLYRLGHLSQAEKYLRQAYAKAPEPEIAAHLGEVLWASGNKAGARRVWSEALKRDPGNRNVIDTRTRLTQ